MELYRYVNGQDLTTFIKNHYFAKYPDHTEQQFQENYNTYNELSSFRACENIHEINTKYNVPDPDKDLADVETRLVKSPITITAEIHWIMRMAAQYYITKAFEAMKVDLDDPNIAENALGKGSPGRISKMWLGNDLEDYSELGSGRWTREPYVSRFPSNGNHSIITKEIDIISNCSHHFLPFTTLEGGKALIKYKPKDYVIGISKLQRLVNWASRRFWLQEDLTDYIGKTLQRIANTEDVYVALEGVVHGCERYRGVCSKDGSLTTEFRSGIFYPDTSLCSHDS